MKLPALIAVRSIVAVCFLAMSGLFALAGQQDVAARWDMVKDSGDPALIAAFREEYPNSPYDLDALVILAALINTTDSGEASLSGSTARGVTFTGPLSGYGDTLDNTSISALLKTTPAFAPVEGLPAEYWQEKPCASCHEWTQASLCTQATHYTKTENVHRLNVEHPLGRPFKEALRNWAEGGCL